MLLILVVTPADEQERAQVEGLAAEGQQVTGENVNVGVAFVDQGYTGAEEAAATHAVKLVVKHTEADPADQGAAGFRVVSSGATSCHTSVWYVQPFNSKSRSIGLFRTSVLPT